MEPLEFLANISDGYPLNMMGKERIDPGVPPGNATFAAPGTEQDALAEFLLAQGQVPCARAETPASLDPRIQNLVHREDSVIRSWFCQRDMAFSGSMRRGG